MEVLNSLSQVNQRQLSPEDDLVHEGGPPREPTIFLSGWGIRYTSLQDGRRQILGYFLPGDIADTNIDVSPVMDHSIAALTKAIVVEISRETIAGLAETNPNIVKAIQLSKAASIASLHETILNLGQRSAVERTAHFLCELFVRMKLICLTDETSCKIAMTRVDIADAIGMTTVHVNRTVKDLRTAGLLDLEGKTLTIPDLERLKRAALFNPSYLYLRPGSAKIG